MPWSDPYGGITATSSTSRKLRSSAHSNRLYGDDLSEQRGLNEIEILLGAIERLGYWS